ncbi:MAG: bifunctional 3-deoxy-7-phosphoheptulonate synthase/chorismate mutase type II [Tunicatimonas sp.]|uniref:chorismate mutase n=1 Tax=Tunicatimonas sp. TaxID=1940096 RepID=UPI003C77B0A4
MKLTELSQWNIGKTDPLIIAGPCSAETEEQLYDTVKAVKEQGVTLMRAGVWKPRTRPNTFEGVGQEALQWIQDIKKDLNVQFSTEVANAMHVEEALHYGIDVLWVGARSTVSPFIVQEIADALRGCDVPVLVKNPINPDLALWMGALERLNQAGVTKLGAIHRGFSTYQKTRFRNVPMWQLPIEMKRQLPGLPMICDPSHIMGKREDIAEASQIAMDLNFEGLIIETHRDPEQAWSDARQQVTPHSLGEIIRNLRIRQASSEDIEYITHLEELRTQIDHSDREMIELLANRLDLVAQIGVWKKKNNVAAFLLDRWNRVFESRKEWAKEAALRERFVVDLFNLLHVESIRKQTEVMDNTSDESETESGLRVKS